MHSRPSWLTWTLSLVVAPWLAGPADAQDAQQRARCPRIQLLERGPTLRQGSPAVIIMWGGMTAVCPTTGIRLEADSAEYYESVDVLYLYRNVRYTEGGTAVTARRMTYWRREERILAEGDVAAVLENGTRMRGPRAEYFRAVPAIRARSRLNATGRPRISLVETDTTRRGRGASPARTDTTHVDANTVVMDGDSLVHAAGQVIVTRPDVVATSDSLALDRARETARLIRSPSIKGTGERPFTMTGAVIDLYSRDRRLERVVSSVRGHVVSKELDLTADTIDLRIADQLLQRAFAWGKSRAKAVTPTQELTADSLDMIMPAQRLRQVHAVGRGSARTVPDSTRISTTDRDLLLGDTLLALFDSVPAGDTTSRTRIRELRARVKAEALYHLAPTDTLSRCANINYSRGGEIVVTFTAGEVRDVLVTRDSLPSSGAYAECARPVTPTADGLAPSGQAPARPTTPPPPPPGAVRPPPRQPR